MATSLYAEQDADFRFKGDYVLVDGTLTVVGNVSLTGATTLGATSVTTTVVGPLKLSIAPTGTTAGVVWTTGAPALTAGQKFVTLQAGSTVYRLPIFDNA